MKDSISDQVIVTNPLHLDRSLYQRRFVEGIFIFLCLMSGMRILQMQPSGIWVHVPFGLGVALYGLQGPRVWVSLFLGFWLGLLPFQAWPTAAVTAFVWSMAIVILVEGWFFFMGPIAPFLEWKKNAKALVWLGLVFYSMGYLFPTTISPVGSFVLGVLWMVPAVWIADGIIPGFRISMGARVLMGCWGIILLGLALITSVITLRIVAFLGLLGCVTSILYGLTGVMGSFLAFAILALTLSGAEASASILGYWFLWSVACFILGVLSSRRTIVN